jgi:diaminopimelate epimerase
MGDVTEIEERGDDVFLDTGSPHHVSCVAAVEKIDVQQQGANIRYGAPYNTAGSNVNFVQKTAPSSFKIRTYERGVEGETLACGTGAVAAAIGVHYLGLTTLNEINIHAMGGALEVSFETTSGHYKNIWLKGPAAFVFSGNFSL